MGRRTETSEIIDSVLKFVVAGGVLTTVLVAPNALQIMDKPIQKYFKRLDQRAKEREWQKLLQYMKNKNLIAESYDHGIKITKTGRARAEKAQLDQLNIPTPKTWDKKWRLVFYDIPEKHKRGRDMLTSKLRQIGFYQLQKSVWVHPFPCHEEIEVISLAFQINKYISYIETTYIDQQDLLKRKFQKLI